MASFGPAVATTTPANGRAATAGDLAHGALAKHIPIDKVLASSASQRWCHLSIRRKGASKGSAAENTTFNNLLRNTIDTMASQAPPKQLILHAFVEACSGHQSPGLWSHPDDESWKFNDIRHWVQLAQMLEKAKFHGIFIADVLGPYDVYKGPRNPAPAIAAGAQWPVNEPLAAVPAMAAATRNIGFGVTVATTYEQPFHLARRLSTVDHLTGGRLGWNIVTGYLDSAARNLGHTAQPAHDERYAMAEEYVDVTYKLWQSSWRDDAVKLDRQKRIYTDPALVREINHRGTYYAVPGPHICQPSPQRTPVILQAGTSPAGRRFAAKHAEAVFVAGHSPAVVAQNVAAIRQTAEREFGRDPRSIHFLALLCPVLAPTQELADAQYAELLRHGSEDGALALFGGWTGIDLAAYADDEELRHVESNAIRSAVDAWARAVPGVPRWTKHAVARHIQVGGLGATVVGTPARVADEMQRWVAEADVDGFNLAYALFPGSFTDIIDQLLPVLRRRGLFWDDYAVDGGTYRENLSARPGQAVPPADHPAAQYHWRAEERKERGETKA